jgi:hypothetical protein
LSVTTRQGVYCDRLRSERGTGTVRGEVPARRYRHGKGERGEVPS